MLARQRVPHIDEMGVAPCAVARHPVHHAAERVDHHRNYGLQQWEIGDFTLGKRSVRSLVDPRPLGVAPLTRMAAWNCIARTSLYALSTKSNSLSR
jgi:hypothetical protein